MTDLLYHVTLTTGDVARTPRSDVSESMIADLRPFVANLLASEPIGPQTENVPGFPEFRVQCITLYGPPLFQVYGPVPDMVAEDDTSLSPCVVWFGVVVEPDDRAEDLWRRLWQLAGLDGEPDPVPTELPWCALVPEAGAVNVPEAAVWVGDFDRSIAWTLWSTRRSAGH